jgi:hypothetical protein
MSSNRRRPFWCFSACIVLANLAAFSPASAKRTPAQLTPTFKDRAPVAIANKGANPSSCSVNFAEIRDERRSPDLVGVVNRRAVRAPADTQAWMRAVLSGLEARGVKVGFRPDAVGAGLSTARLILQTAWIAGGEVTYSGNVVVKLEARAEGGRTIDQIYRGRASRTAYWSGGADTLQSAVDGAFADALDAMAADLRNLCTP